MMFSKKFEDLQLRIYACYEGDEYKGELSPFHPLNGEMDEASLLNFLKELHDYGGDEDDNQNAETPAALVKSLLAREDQVVAGGLVIIGKGFRLIPGCCCGLEGWVEWKDLKKGSHSPWFGHDPFPGVDTRGDKAILHNGLNVEQESYELSYEELSKMVEQVSFTLSQFLGRLQVFLNNIDCKNSERLTQKIAEWFHITPLSS
ncbi:hypothetical protein [Hellea balneolensis]|uniref:hypothetical protein n=1 Tax=Hellea balneolensis TaxID=287478 RepID=UPI00047A7FA4|nr:hypothetical protein [Hellea balneolensis]